MSRKALYTWIIVIYSISGAFWVSLTVMLFNHVKELLK